MQTTGIASTAQPSCQSYNALYSWLAANGFEASDFAREFYIDGIWNKDDPNEWVTEIQLPVRSVG